MLKTVVDLNYEQKIVRVACSGILNMSMAPEVSKSGRMTARNLGMNLLFDFRGLELDVDKVDIYNFPRQTDALQDPELKTLAVALLVKAGEDEENWKFYETTSRNAGVNVRVFVDNEPAAVEWLVGLHSK